ncbi:uncharacterized protein LOC124268967 [Haliotis rubra]|uniref:uncharacterized protein LOC124268967 n=1 Tax=Haliotis rubra TaxID=36100 RepID=UPI001EE56D28|nr:uncharacterized protein LOC124268967 [Haliotis rubra]
MSLLTTVLAVLPLFVDADVDLASPLVFDPIFYVNTNADLHHLGINTEAAAKQHWLSKGISEGRQGCGSFHSRQYLKRYSDLTKAYGTDYHQAVVHYLNHQSEKRLGYVDGGYSGRWTISNHDHDLFVSASGRMGGAIDSLVWDNKEFINAWDHGRELQMATNTHPYGECFNPTEAGGRDDSIGPSTKSKIISISSHGSTLKTTNHPAFWLRHGGHEAPGSKNRICSGGAPARNTVDTYGYDFSKNVTIGCAGMSHCIKFESMFTVAGEWPAGVTTHNFEAPTGYMTKDFRVLKGLNLGTGRIQPYASGQPVVLATSDLKHAMGAYAPTGQDTDEPHYYSGIVFGSAFPSGTSKWGSVFRKKAFPHGSSNKLFYVTYICVGSLDQVSECLKKLHATYPKV